ncbi:MAG: TIGR04222 domain-containing membrane protein [Fibrobacteres bacterium]|nr:TIGR04222 domain-containing membrane protein [Fibrobacterota bacterium]
MIPGPLFLLILVGLTGLGIYFHFYRPWWPGRANPDRGMSLTPYELAYLARGRRGVIETALATADADGLIEVDAETKLAIPLPDACPDDRVLAELLRELTLLGGSLRGLKLSSSVHAVRRSLTQCGLLDGASAGRVALRGFAIFGTLEGLALAKLFLGLHLGKPVTFLFLLALVILAFLGLSLWAQGRRGFPTLAGRRCLNDRRHALESLLFDHQAARTQPGPRAVMTAVFGFHEISTSLWGAAIPLAGIAIAASPLWLNPHAPAQSPPSGSGSGGESSSTSSDSGCGGGSSDSGCGGGSSGGDSGCGGGGGGCGGCGGGGD